MDGCVLHHNYSKYLNIFACILLFGLFWQYVQGYDDVSIMDAYSTQMINSELKIIVPFAGLVKLY